MKKQTRHTLSRRKFLITSGVTAGAVATHTLAQSTSEKALSSPATAAAGSKRTDPVRPMMKMAEIFGPPEDRLWRLVKQCGADHVVGTFSRGRGERAPDEKPWSYESLERPSAPRTSFLFTQRPCQTIQNRPVVHSLLRWIPFRRGQKYSGLAG